MKMSKEVAFRGITLYLFASGMISLFISPFLHWYYYGTNFFLPPVVSLVTPPLFLNPPFLYPLLLYFTGFLAAIIVALVARRPVFFHEILTGVFPLFFIFAHIHPCMPHLAIYGVFAALLGSVLSEASYFSYRTGRNARIGSKATTTGGSLSNPNGTVDLVLYQGSLTCGFSLFRFYHHFGLSIGCSSITS
jgi:hypothetical protein